MNIDILSFILPSLKRNEFSGLLSDHFNLIFEFIQHT